MNPTHRPEKKEKKMPVRIYPTDRNNATDAKMAKVMEQMVNAEWERYKDIVSAIVAARRVIEMTYGIDTGDRIWDRIMEEVVRYDMDKLQEKK